MHKQLFIIMKGYAIMFIVLHNFFHMGRFDFIKENENSFDISRTLDFFYTLKNVDLADIGHFFSFLGWIGVPVFIFSSGYGLVKKYDGLSFDAKHFLFYNYLKLLFLLIPALLCFVFLSFLVETWSSFIPNCLLQLTFLSNWFMPYVKVFPGVYWYFGLTFELYLSFILIRKFSVNNLLLLCCVLIFLQFFVVYYWGVESNVWSWFRHNMFGWSFLFLLGMILSNLNCKIHFPFLKSIMYAGTSLVLVAVSMLNVWSWLFFVPIFSLSFFVFLCLSSEKILFLKKIGLWLGSVSAPIFVVHPIVRTILFIVDDKVSMPFYLLLFSYLVSVFVIAPFYKYIYEYFLYKLFVRK